MDPKQSQPTDATSIRFVEVITDETLISRTSSSPPDHNKDDFPPFDYTDVDLLINQYNSTFPSLQQYTDFMQQDLGPWNNTLELKYFDQLYTSYRTARTTNHNVRQLAQKLLTKADKLQQSEEQHRYELLQYLLTITRQTLCGRLCKPTKVYPKGNPSTTTYRLIPSLTSP